MLGPVLKQAVSGLGEVSGGIAKLMKSRKEQ